jgi:phosphate/sulfate permease
VVVKTLRPVDIAVGCFLALLGLFIIYEASLIRMGVARSLSPRTIPYALGFLISFCGIGLAVKSWRFRGEDPKINWPDREGVGIILVQLIFLACYITLMNPLGLPLSTFLYVTFSIWCLKLSKRGMAMAIVIGLFFGIISYYVFIQLLGLSFPAGFLFE